MNFTNGIARTALIVCGVALLASVATPAQQATGLQEQVEKLNAGQDALRKEIQAMQRQLQEIRTLLQTRPAPQAAAPAPALPAELPTDGAPFKGAPNAPVTIVEFSDFQCPFCARHWQQTYGQLDREYISTGKVRYVFRHFPLEAIHPQAFRAGEAAECAAGQGKFWEMHDRLFLNPKTLMPADLAQHAQALGLDMTRFTTCFNGQATARIRADLAMGTAAGVSATPNFFIGVPVPGGKIKVLRKLNGAVPFATFKATLDGLLAAAPPAQ